MRALPDALKFVLEQIPKDAHPMDVMRTSCSMLGNLETEADFSEQDDKIDRMLAVFPSIITYWYRFANAVVGIEEFGESGSGPEVYALRGMTLYRVLRSARDAWPERVLGRVQPEPTLFIRNVYKRRVASPTTAWS